MVHYQRLLAVAALSALVSTSAEAACQIGVIGSGCTYTVEAIPGPGIHTGARFGANQTALMSSLNDSDALLDLIVAGDLGPDGIIDTGKVTSSKILDGTVAAIDVAADVATQADLDGKSAATSVANQIPRFSNTTGDQTPSNLTTDAAGNNFTIPGTLTVGGQVLADLVMDTSTITPGTTTGPLGRLHLETDATTNALCLNYNGTTGWKCFNAN